MKRVTVRWVDSCFQNDWVKPEEIECKVSECESTGYLVHDTETAITVALSKSDTGRVSDCITIPRVAIKSMAVIEMLL